MELDLTFVTTMIATLSPYEETAMRKIGSGVAGSPMLARVRQLFQHERIVLTGPEGITFELAEWK